MEYVQRVLYMCYFITVSSCLNPYFNGTCSKSFARKRNTYQRNRLNPYFNGTCSKSQHENSFLPSRFDVLILILMEHAQRGTEYKNPWSNNAEVLILILMEHAQRVWLSNAEAQRYLGLNPYFNGTCSKRKNLGSKEEQNSCLNPYFNGTCSKRNRANNRDKHVWFKS